MNEKDDLLHLKN